MPNANGWKTYVPLIALLIIQTLAGIWWASRVTTRQEFIIDQMKDMRGTLEGYRIEMKDVSKQYNTINREVVLRCEAINDRLRRLENAR